MIDVWLSFSEDIQEDCCLEQQQADKMLSFISAHLNSLAYSAQCISFTSQKGIIQVE